MMSSRTLGTSAKKNRAKKPATPPNPAARVPLYYVSASSGTGKVDVQLDEVAGGDAVEVALDGVPGSRVSSSPECVDPSARCSPASISPRQAAAAHLPDEPVFRSQTYVFLLFLHNAAAPLHRVPTVYPLSPPHPSSPLTKKTRVYVLGTKGTPVSLIRAAVALSSHQHPSSYYPPATSIALPGNQWLGRISGELTKAAIDLPWMGRAGSETCIVANVGLRWGDDAGG